MVTFIAIVAALAAAGFIWAAVFAYIATRPIQFEFVGNDPDGWVIDIEGKVSLHNAKAEQCAYCDEMLKSNRAAMSASSIALRRSSIIAGLTVIGCVVVIALKSLT